MMFLSPETYLGLKITGMLTLTHAIMELVEFLCTIPGVKAFLSEKLSQDPLETFFWLPATEGEG